MITKNFTSQAEALAYLIKRLDGTVATFEEVTEQGGASTKGLTVKTMAIYEYESNFSCQVPNDAPVFANFVDFVKYWEGLGKVQIIENVESMKESDFNYIQSDNPNLLWVNGQVANNSNIEAILFVKDPVKVDGAYNETQYYALLFGLMHDVAAGKQIRKCVYRHAILNNTADGDQLIYEDHPTFGA